MGLVRTTGTPKNGDSADSRRIVAVLAAGLLASGSFVVITGLAGLGGPGASASSACGPGVEMLQGLPGPIACVHEDVPPPGVDVTEHVSTRELLSREGAGPTAHEAAEELGVPSAPAAAATSPAVACDGDGTSGNRVQAMYVVEADDPNRFAALEDSMKLWAAGVDDVVNRSAALSGGVRRVRYVTETGDGSSCEAKILDVTVPAGALASFASSIDALQDLGYDAAGRKYLMWTDTNVMCGVGLMYLDDRPGQDNANNGRYPQYARTDSGCWGFGNGTSSSSVAAHELLHSLGGVQGSAPNSTPAGHCTDESDAMCYEDGTGTVQPVCPAEREYLFDCNLDDYFSTSPAPGSYLDLNWNSADSAFLIGGGDGLAASVTAPTNVTDLTATVNKVDVGYGDSVRVTGRLTKTSGNSTTGSTAGVPDAPVAVTVTAPDKAPVTVGSGRTLADGTYSLSVPLKVSGTLTASYAGGAGLPADSVALGSVTAGTWSTAVTMTAAPFSTGYLLDGVVRKTYAGTTVPAAGVRVKVMFTPRSTGVPRQVGSVVTNASGGYTAKVYPSVRGTHRVVVSGRAGYADSASGTHVVTRQALHRLRNA